ncbi:TRAP transporter substrate-binding protein [Variovorax sp. J22R133]|uniref:TRAP transporter substrate-binding protein n=1 Tax=Variovorax brevis TaxID=3053503 RepID=UPI0025779193|nr:TRAP transporter substrate-binding protein [Variovorax sp. J22R133]MDM0116833.1 TRAP transporter substrate-binding protein [Variovorax sp. J22R133]
MVSTSCAIAQQQQPVIVKFSHVTAEDTPKGRAALYFKGLVEKRTKGKVVVEVYPNSKLYKDADEFAALQSGKVQMLAPSLSKFPALGLREFGVFDLPYIFDNYADVHRIVLGPIGKNLLKKLEPKGILGLTYWDNGFKQFSANRPLKKPDDIKGLKIRIQASVVLESQMHALGAIPRAMDFSDTLSALKAGTVDGTENPISNFYTQRMQEVQRYLALTNHGYLGYAVIVNKKFWDALPIEIRTTLNDAMREATIFANDIASESNNDALEALRAEGKTEVIRLTPQEKAEWKKALVVVHRNMEDGIGRALVRSIYKETNFNPDHP